MSALTTALIVGFLGLQISAQSASTCSPYSAAACPTAFSSCCAYICAEAQVPFAVCQPTDGSGQFASCSACPGAPLTSTVTSSPTITTIVSSATTSASTCSPYSATGCPASSNACCAYICAEAQVPFAVCQPTDGSGQFAKCTPCSGSAPTSHTNVSGTTTTQVIAVTSAPYYGNATVTGSTSRAAGSAGYPSSNVTGTAAPTVSSPVSGAVSLSSYIVGAASTAIMGTICLVLVL